MKPFTTIVIILFSLIAFMHHLRLFFGWEVAVNGKIVPNNDNLAVQKTLIHNDTSYESELF